jgi:hypothetical protein
VTAGAVLDAGALIAFERGTRRAVVLVARALSQGARLAVPAGVVTQVWRDGARQARLATLLGAAGVDVVTLDDRGARAAGQLLGVSGTSDVVDATVVWCARRLDMTVVSDDADDLRAIDPTVRVVAC